MQGDNIPLEEMRRVQREEKRRLLRTPHEEWKTRQRALAEAREKRDVDPQQEPPQRKVEALKIKKSRITEVRASISSSSEDDATWSDSLGLQSDSPVPSASQKQEETETTTTSASATSTTTTTATSSTKVKHKKLRTSKTT